MCTVHGIRAWYTVSVMRGHSSFIAVVTCSARRHVLYRLCAYQVSRAFPRFAGCQCRSLASSKHRDRMSTAWFLLGGNTSAQRDATMGTSWQRPSSGSHTHLPCMQARRQPGCTHTSAGYEHRPIDPKTRDCMQQGRGLSCAHTTHIQQPGASALPAPAVHTATCGHAYT